MEPSIIGFRVSEQESEKIKALAKLRFVQKKNGMKKNNVSEYMKSLVNEDFRKAMREIRRRRAV